jgi:UDP-glucose 4-epimerase
MLGYKEGYVMKVLVTGGAGYIGSHMVLRLLEAGYQPVVVDDLSTGTRSLVPSQVPLHVFDIGEADKLSQLFQSEKFDVVMHFAASIKVGESVQFPGKYYHNNFKNTVTLLDVMQQQQVKRIIFSSTAAIFGNPKYTPADEAHPKDPINPYGASKLMCEYALRDFDIAYGIKSVSLRYFNAAGADALGRTGYRVHDASHIIPSALQTALGIRKQLELFGRDYPTPDGTCVRDYIHVMDLCEAHLAALQYLKAGGESKQYNLGNGQGYTVQQVIDTARKITGKSFEVISASRRAGDPPALVADSTLAKAELGWQPKYPDLETIMQHALQWEKKCK